MSGDAEKTRQELARERDDALRRVAELENRLKRPVVFDGMLDGLTEPIFVKDADHRFVYYNQAFADLTGVEADHLVGRRDDEFFPPEEVEVFLRVDREVLESRETRRVEENVTVDGEVRRMRTVKCYWEHPRTGEPLILGVIHDITGRVRLEEANRREREALEVIFNGSLDAVFLAREDASFFMVNLAAERLTGYSRAELLKMRIPDLHEDMDLGAYRRCFPQILAGEAMVSEAPLLRKDGSKVDVEFSNTRVEIGGVAYMHTVARDVTERRRAEEELRSSEERSTALANATFEAIFISEDGVCVETNRAASEMFGYSYEELIGIFGTDVISEDTKHIVRRNMLSGYEEPYEAVAVRKDGTHFPAQFQGRMFRYRGRPVRITAVRDLTERKRAERRLAESERKYRLLAENMEDVIFLLDARQRVTYVSPGLNRLLGMSPEEAASRALSELMTPESLGRVLEARERRDEAMRTGDTHLVNRIELEMYRRGGGTVWVEVVSRGMLDEQGRFSGVVGLARNVDERKRMEGQLRKAKETAESASRAKSEFLANVSHEIRTPLNGMLGMLQLLRGNELDPATSEMIGTALECGRSLVAIINDILDLSQIEAGVVRLHTRNFRPAETVASVLYVFEHQAEARGLDLRCELAADLPETVHGDEGRLRQVLFNLVGNAMKFTEQGGVRVGVWPLEQDAHGAVRLLFSVRDTGIGIPDGHVHRIFENFSQVDGSYTRRYGGAGLGLGIVRRLVGLLGGGLSVDTEAGRGTEVFFSLRFARVDEKSAPKRSANRPAVPEKQRLRVLLAEDDRVGRLAVVRMLERIGHDCTAVECGADALRELAEGGYHCALLDIQMPDMSGLQVAEAARKLYGDDRERPLLVALTAHAMYGDRESFLERGMDAYLPKPVDIADLEALLAGTLSTPIQDCAD